MKTIIVVFISFLVNSITYSQTFRLDDALKNAKQENKKIIVDVYTDWCLWCKKMKKDVYNNTEVKKMINENFIYVRLNAEGNDKNKYNGKIYTDSELAELFQVTGFPTTVFLTSDGNVIEFLYDGVKMLNFPGYITKDEFLKIIQYFKDEKYKDTDLSKFL